MEIIVVDDHRIYRKSLIRIIERLFPDSHIYEAENGFEFLELQHSIPNIDLVIMDLKMPRMDGIETTRKGLLVNPDLKVLGISVYGTEENIEAMLEAGALGFLQKGGDKHGIEKAIKTVLAGGIYVNNTWSNHI